MIKVSVFQLIFSLIIYFSLSYIAMVDVVKYPYVHDYFHVSFPNNWVIVLTAHSIPALSVLYRLLHYKNLHIYIKRAALLYLLKAFVQFVTIVPSVYGIRQCTNRTWIESILFVDNCADMMFSGHTGLTMLMLPNKWRFQCVILVGLTLKLSEMHYTSDIIIAVIVALQIEQWVPFEKDVREMKTHLIPQENSQDGIV
jgi:hypothetical protein